MALRAEYLNIFGAITHNLLAPEGVAFDAAVEALAYWLHFRASAVTFTLRQGRFASRNMNRLAVPLRRYQPAAR